MKNKLILLLLLFTIGCGIDPEKTYTVYSVTDSNGKTYHNLIRCGGEGYFIDIHRKEYHFHGNFTEIGQEVSGKTLLEKMVEKE